jgi:hypothetical protein
MREMNISNGLDVNDVDDLAESAAFENSLDFHVVRRIAKDVTDPKNDVCLFDSLGHGAALGSRSREWLLAEYVVAQLGKGDHTWHVLFVLMRSQHHNNQPCERKSSVREHADNKANQSTRTAITTASQNLGRLNKSE